MKIKKAVGIWVRVSSDMQGDSPEHHEKRARYYAESKGWEAKCLYRLEAVSGKSVMGRHETKKMLEDIASGEITGIIFSKLARLARNTRELLDFAEIFQQHNADLISLDESIDTSTPAGRFFYTMIAALAQWEREEISARIAASVPIRAKLGKLISGKPPFGYRWTGTEIVLDEKEAPVRKLIYELFLKYKRKTTVAREINNMGYRTSNGKKFGYSTIRRLIRDPMAKGERRANYTKSQGRGKSWVLKPRSEWVITECPAIVSEELWNECNRIMDEQEKKVSKPGPRPVYLLSGFVHCSCGKKMYVFHSKPGLFKCKDCKNRIQREDIEEIYHQQLKTFLLTDVDMNKYMEKSDQEFQQKEQLLNVQLKESAKLKKEMDELIGMRLREELERDAFKRHYQPLEEQLKQIEDDLPELQAEVDFLKIQLASSDQIIRDAQNLYESWPSLNLEQKRTIVELITEKITVGQEDISISLTHLPSFSQNGGKSHHIN